MSSQRRIQASQANGARSCGPVTESGKQASAANSQRHGMLSQTVVLVGESEERFQALLDSFINDYKPTNTAETSLVETMAVARWRQLRTWCIQKSDFDREMARHEGSPVRRAAIAFRSLADNSRSLDLVHRYETSYDRQFLRALRQLKDLRSGPPADHAVPNFPVSTVTATFE